MEDELTIEVLVGKTLKAITVNDGNDEVIFECLDGDCFRAYHMQDCCEYVRIALIEGEPKQLLGSPITEATEHVAGVETDHYGSETMTTHTLSTAEVTVVFRWLGESNGYYDESVYFTRTHAPI